ncbi:lipoyl protein ligase domain-containing protein [Sphingopyxis sp.]|uniref:lipoyl protein ligase domain-containing protein n=1 Tax=Sphingopyxis sp. TaxID=1908224 RepID=UPI003BAABEF4
MPGSIEAQGPPPLLERVARAIAPDIPVEPGHGAAAIDEDVHRLDRLLGEQQERQVMRLWTNSACLVTTRRFAAMRDFDDAAVQSHARGWPVFVRRSGGTTVVHRPGMLNASRFDIWRSDEIGVVDRFRRFADDLAGSLRSLGFSAATGAIARSHCDGRFNIIVDGRKIAGTASLFRQRQGWSGLLSHATIWVEGDVRADISAVTRFECNLGLKPDYDADAHANLVGKQRDHSRLSSRTVASCSA